MWSNGMYGAQCALMLICNDKRLLYSMTDGIWPDQLAPHPLDWRQRRLLRLLLALLLGGCGRFGLLLCCLSLAALCLCRRACRLAASLWSRCRVCMCPVARSRLVQFWRQFDRDTFGCAPAAEQVPSQCHQIGGIHCACFVVVASCNGMLVCSSVLRRDPPSKPPAAFQSCCR